MIDRGLFKLLKLFLFFQQPESTCSALSGSQELPQAAVTMDIFGARSISFFPNPSEALLREILSGTTEGAHTKCFVADSCLPVNVGVVVSSV